MKPPTLLFLRKEGVGVLRIFSPLKIHRLGRFEPANLGSNGKHINQAEKVTTMLPYIDHILYSIAKKLTSLKFLVVLLRNHSLIPV
jgi:hypothetical protein